MIKLLAIMERNPFRSCIVMPLIPKFCTHRFLSPIVGNVGIFETIEGVEELFDQTSEIAEIQESMGVCRIRRRMVG